jgi:histidinol-phosphate aminotransferase
MRKIEALVKSYILNLKAYSSARNECMSDDGIWLDANENNFGNAEFGERFNRYPDPQQLNLKRIIATQFTNVLPAQIFVGNGSDEALDLLFRVFIESGSDAVAVCSPTYGMYKVLADSYNAEVMDVPLIDNFQLDVTSLIDLPKNCKILFLCSPNNPTGNDLKTEDIEQVLTSFDGIVVVDEAYVHFSDQASWINRLSEFPNLVVTQTLSKAHGLAGLRVGMAFASPLIIGLLNKVKLPYNMNAEVLRLAEKYLKDQSPENIVKEVKTERKRVFNALEENENITKVFPTSANFILFTCDESEALYDYLKGKGVIIRNRKNDYPNALRVSIGKPVENNLFLSLIKTFYTP